MGQTPFSSFKSLFDLSGRVALITGAAAGFGQVMARGFAEFGCDVAAADLNLEGATATAQAVCALGRRAVPIAVDVGCPEQIEAMVKTAADALGPIDILVNSAGIPQHDPLETTPLETWDRVIDVNLRGTFLCTQAVVRLMLPRGRGVILNFSSIAGLVGCGRGVNVYSASKAGVNGLTKQMAIELAPRGIRVNAIAPCQFMTPGLEDVMRDPQFDPRKLMETWTSNIPLGRVGEPWEMVGPALFLVSDASSMVTGVILEVDGGYLAR